MGKLRAGVGQHFMFDFYENLRNLLGDSRCLLDLFGTILIVVAVVKIYANGNPIRKI